MMNLYIGSMDKSKEIHLFLSENFGLFKKLVHEAPDCAGGVFNSSEDVVKTEVVADSVLPGVRIVSVESKG